MNIKPPLLLLLLLSSPLHAASLEEARRFTDARDYAAAIAQFEELVHESPANADLLIEAARVNGWADRNAEAARLYERAVDAAPQRLADIRAALAWQLLWSGQAGRALVYFEAELAAHPENMDLRHGKAEALVALNRLGEALAVYGEQAARFPDDLKAKKGRARVALWLGRLDEARQGYEAVLATSPGDREARLGLARIDSQGGRHQAAAARLRTLLGEAEDGEVRAEFARALRWSGDEAGALDTLAAATGTDAVALRRQLRNRVGPRVALNAESSRDSDDLDLRALAVEASLRPAKRRRLDLSLRQAWLSENSAAINGRTWLLGYGATLGEAGGPHGLLFPSLHLGLRDYAGWRSPAVTARLKWLPSDAWRWDIEAGNTIVENVRSVQNEVRLDYLSGGFDYGFAPRWQGSLGVMAGRFDDGNQRTRLTGRLAYRAADDPWFIVGVEGMGFNDREPPVPWRGYWSPERYREIKLAASASATRAGWDLYLKAALGRLWETPGGSNTLYQLEASAGHEVGDWGQLTLYGGYSDSAALTQGSGGGYHRGYFGGTLYVPF